MENIGNPLKGPPPKEVPLPKAPLVRVIAQVRFPLIVSLEKQEFMAPFQESMRSQYPVLRPEQSQGVVLGPQGLVPAQPQKIWRFNEVAGKWRVSLAPDFIALETTSYSSRQDFFDRLTAVLNALQQHFEPKVVDRVGVRYIDRLVGPALLDIAKLVRPEVLGILAAPPGSQVEHMIAESLFSLPESSAMLLLRQGRLPKGSTVDPSAIDPIDEPSWILDIDMFRQQSREFVAEQISNEARGFAERIYAFFRWAVTEDFLRFFGGRV
jgi:uncharacterized protein (TIGR04255 family)